MEHQQIVEHLQSLMNSFYILVYHEVDDISDKAEIYKLTNAEDGFFDITQAEEILKITARIKQRNDNLISNRVFYRQKALKTIDIFLFGAKRAKLKIEKAVGEHFKEPYSVLEYRYGKLLLDKMLLFDNAETDPYDIPNAIVFFEEIDGKFERIWRDNSDVI